MIYAHLFQCLTGTLEDFRRRLVMGPEAEAAVETGDDDLESAGVAIATGEKIVGDHAEVIAEFGDIPLFATEDAGVRAFAGERIEFAGDGFEKSLEYAKKKPEIVKAYMKEFTNPRYGVDVLKLEVPVNMQFVEGAKSFKGQKAYTVDEAKEHFRDSAKATNLPFIYLSAGVSNAEFIETLELVGASGVKFNGVLCGRATWKDGIAIYAQHGAKAFHDWISTEGVKNIDNVNKALEAASSWFPIYGVEEVGAAR